MTRLDAINSILRMVNEASINSLDDASPEAQDVDELITEITRDVCVDNQPFNILPYRFQPDSNGEIAIPATILGVEPEASCGNVRVISKKLYNVASRTYSFSGVVEADCKLLFDFEELEDVVQNFIVKQAAVKKVATDLGNGELMKMAVSDLEISRDSYVSYNLEMLEYNMLDNPEISQFSRYYHNL